MQGMEPVSGLWLGLRLVELEDELEAITAEARALEQHLSALSHTIAQTRRLLVTLPEGSNYRRSVTALLGIARMYLLRLRADLDQKWAAVGARQWAVALVRVEWEDARPTGLPGS